jgi:hypothetical protein
VTAVLDVPTDVVVPDSIEAVEEWRTWKFDGSNLVSITNDTVWKAGEPLKASCNGSDQVVWALKRGGWTVEQAAAHASNHNQRASISVNMWSNRFISRGQYLSVPRVEPPEGYGYTLEVVTHAAPHANCTCGIYAGRSLGDCPSGDVLGKVKLWGTLVPGEKGSRAEFAYPSELHVPSKLANDPALLAYGVPIVVVEAKKLAASTQSPHAGRSGMPWLLKFSVAVNFGACALNLGLLALRSL